jgi:succinate dehydrogenase / fumarate reductase cytochrome b subunit
MSQTYHYLVRRLHSFAGIFPVGIFLLMHLFINSFALRGEAAYNRAVGFVNNIPGLVYLEILLIGVPIAFHALYGLWVTYVTKTSIFQYYYFRNWMFYLQRLTAVITLIFVVWHVWVLRIVRVFTGTEMTFLTVQAWLANPLYLTFYIIGLLAAVYHFSNGLWSFLVTWGITIGPESQRLTLYVCTVIFILLGIAGINSVYAFIR